MIIHEEGYVYNFNYYLVFVTKYCQKKYLILMKKLKR